MMQAVNASRGYDHRDGIYRYRGAYTTTFSPWLYDVTQKAIRDCFMISHVSKTFLLWLSCKKDFWWENVASTEWVKSSYEFGDPVPIIAIMYLALPFD